MQIKAKGDKRTADTKCRGGHGAIRTLTHCSWDCRNGTATLSNGGAVSQKATDTYNTTQQSHACVFTHVK